jgi:hypothetical protein
MMLGRFRTTPYRFVHPSKSMPFNFKIGIDEENVVNIETFEFFDADEITMSYHEPFWRVTTFVETRVAVDGGVGSFGGGND